MAKRVCDACGTKVPTGRLFCGKCGNAIKPAEPKKPISKKTIGILIGALVGVATLVGVIFVLFPAPLTAKDIRINLNIPSSSELWAGGQIDVSSKVTFYSQRDAKYTVVIETKNATITDWAEFTSVTGRYPAIEVTKSAEITPGANEFRVLVYLEGQPKPIVTGKEQVINAKQAYLPIECPIDEINQRWATPSDPMSVFPNDTETHKDCSMAYPNSDVFGPMAYYDVMSDKAFEVLKKKEHGQKFKANVNESAAYKYFVRDDFMGNYWIYVVNYHGIVLHTDSQSDLAIFVNAISVK